MRPADHSCHVIQGMLRAAGFLTDEQINAASIAAAKRRERQAQFVERYMK